MLGDIELREGDRIAVKICLRVNLQPTDVYIFGRIRTIQAFRLALCDMVNPFGELFTAIYPLRELKHVSYD